MAVYKVLALPDTFLRTRCKPVQKVNEGIVRLLENLKDTMYQYNGLGLAAPQIGVARRVIVFDIGEGPVEMVNPEITEQDGEQIGPEGCLSIPDTQAQVKRANRVVVEAWNRNGEKFCLEGVGLKARVLQHEIDHLDGILFVDRAEPASQDGGI